MVQWDLINNLLTIDDILADSSDEDEEQKLSVKTIRRRCSDKRKKNIKKNYKSPAKPTPITIDDNNHDPPLLLSSQAAKSRVKRFRCGDCREIFAEMKILKDHQLQPHTFFCHVSDCPGKFETKPKLVQHLKAQHGIQHINIDGQNSGYITTERSQDNIQIAEWALDWIK